MDSLQLSVGFGGVGFVKGVHSSVCFLEKQSKRMSC